MKVIQFIFLISKSTGRLLKQKIIMLVVRLMVILAVSEQLKWEVNLVMASSNPTVQSRVSGDRELRDVSCQVLNISNVLQNILDTPHFISVLLTTHSKRVC